MLETISKLIDCFQAFFKKIHNVQLNLSKTATLKKTKNWFSRPSIAYAGRKYCRMLQGDHSAIL